MRAHFSAPPCGWPRDAIDAALISLFGSGHLRATVNGVALPARGLDQGKVPSADFRVESATVDTRQRLKARKLFQRAEVDCKPGEEAAAAARFLATLLEVAARAGCDAPLPARPDTGHLTEMQSLAGNEQLLAVLDRHEELLANLNDWTRAAELAAARLPSFGRLQSLARHAEGLGRRSWTRSRRSRRLVGGLRQDRRLLDATDPVPEVARQLGACRYVWRWLSLRKRVTRLAAYEESSVTRLEAAGSWKQIQLRVSAKRSSDGCASNGQQVPTARPVPSGRCWRPSTASPLPAGRCGTAALPAVAVRRGRAWTAADKLVEPANIRRLKLASPTLRTADDRRSVDLNS